MPRWPPSRTARVGFRAAERGYRRAMELDSSYATAFHWLASGSMRRRDGRRRPSNAWNKRSSSIRCRRRSSPTPPWSDASTRNSTRAAMYCRRALELDPHFHRPFWFLGLSLGWNGHFRRRRRRAQARPGALSGCRLPLAAARCARLRLRAVGKARAGRTVKHELDRMREPPMPRRSNWHRSRSVSATRRAPLACSRTP